MLWSELGKERGSATSVPQGPVKQKDQRSFVWNRDDEATGSIYAFKWARTKNDSTTSNRA